MSDTKWTPGPWEVRRWDGDEWPDKRISVGAENGGHCVCISPRYRWNEGDANLIAAAPELYEALKDCLNAFSGLPDDALGVGGDIGVEGGEVVDRTYPILRELLDKVDVALHKARGEQ